MTRVFVALLLLSSFAVAGDPKVYDKGELLEMTAVECGYDEKSGKGFTGVLLGTDSANRKTRATLCHEYLLRSDRLIYRVRPKEDKKPTLLPVGERVEFRIKKDKFYILVREIEDKEREYIVVSMTPVAKTEARADAATK